MLRIFFPGLYEKRSQTSNYNTKLSEEELAEFYNEGIRPAVEFVGKGFVHDWPPSFAAEVFRARGHRAGIVNSTKIMPKDQVYRFGEQLKRFLTRNVSWGKNIIFQSQIRGVKNAYIHRCTLNSATTTLAQFLDILDTSHGMWWIDVGLEYWDTERAILWRSDAFHHLVSVALGIHPDTAAKLTASSKMRIDLASHFSALAGFGLKTDNAQGFGPFSIPFIQAYTTDKQVTYHPEGGYYGKFITPKMAMKGLPPPFCVNLRTAYEDAKKTVDVAARIEIRIPLKHALDTLLWLPDNILRMSLVSMKRSVWW